MRLTTKLSAFITLISVLAMVLMLVGCAFSVFWLTHQRVESRVQVLATEVDNVLLSQPPDALKAWLAPMLPVINAEQLSLYNGRQPVFTLSRHENQMLEHEKTAISILTLR